MRREDERACIAFGFRIDRKDGARSIGRSLRAVFAIRYWNEKRGVELHD